jgi:hypothetical protein
MRIAIAGCGALGSHIAVMIAKQEHDFDLFDHDRIQAHNVLTGTTVYNQDHIGNFKARVLAGILYSKYGIKACSHIKAVHSSISFDNYDLVVDCFDNIEARRFTTACAAKTKVHVGVAPQMIGAVEWADNGYQLPKQDMHNEVCTHEVGRNIILLTSVIASIIISNYLETGVQQDAVVSGLEIYK